MIWATEEAKARGEIRRLLEAQTPERPWASPRAEKPKQAPGTFVVETQQPYNVVRVPGLFLTGWHTGRDGDPWATLDVEKASAFFAEKGRMPPPMMVPVRVRLAHNSDEANAAIRDLIRDGGAG